ncbi:MAG TPA: cupin domain-containing protein [Chloroflexota bacterium]
MEGRDASTFETSRVPAEPTDLAPDQSEIRVLASLKGGGLSHCTLPPRRTSLAVTHRTVDEIWYFLSGRGQIWRKRGDQVEIVDAHAGLCLTIPLGTHFQFRNTGWDPLCFIIITMPPWPGEQEAVRVEDHWQVQ